MKKLSAVIITYNEERNIQRALKSVDFADEIVIVDSFSDDKTLEICKDFTGNIHQREFTGHIDQKNFALSLAKNDWALSIDADEEVTKELKEEIIKVMSGTDKNLSRGYKFPRRTFYLGRWIRHSGWYPDYNIRLVNKNHAKWGGIDPSDKLMLDGKCTALKGDLLHYPYKNVSHHLRTINSYTSITAQRLFDSGRKAIITDIVLRPVFSFFKKFILKLGFLDGLAGFIIAVTTAFYTFSKYLKLRELNKNAIDDVHNQ